MSLNKKPRTLRMIDRISLFRYHLPKITPTEHKPLDVIQVDFLSNIFHLYTAGANINTGVPYQGFMLIRTVFETIVKDMRLISLFEQGEDDFNNMYSWITQRDGPGWNPELVTWGFARNRDYLFEGETHQRVRDLYGNLSKLIHGSSRLAQTNISFSDEMIESAWDHLYWIGLNSLLLLIYSHREHMPLDRLYQDNIIDITKDFGYAENFLMSSKLPDLNFQWLDDQLKKS